MKKIFLVLIILFVSMSFIFYLKKTYSPPVSEKEKQEKLAKILGRNPVLSEKEIAKGNVVYNGKYMNFLYPARAKIYTYRDRDYADSKENLESFSFDIENPRIVFTAQVASNSSNLTLLTDIPGVRVREMRSDYKKEEISKGSNNGLVFVNHDTPEKTAFFIINKRIYSFAVTGNNFSEVQNVFSTVSENLEFKN